MTDILKPVNGEFNKRYRDMLDGSHAEVTSPSGGDMALAVGALADLVAAVGTDVDVAAPGNGTVIAILKYMRELLLPPIEVGIRITAVRTVTIANGASLSDAFDMRGYAIAYIEIPGTWTAANLGIVTAEALAGTYQAVGARDRYGTRDVISGIQTSELCLYEAPPAWAGAHFAKLISLNTGTGAAENQGGDRTIRVFLKS